MRYALFFIIFIFVFENETKTQIVFTQKKDNSFLKIKKDSVKTDHFWIEIQENGLENDTIWENGGILIIDKFQDIFFTDTAISFLVHHEWGIIYYLLEKEENDKWKTTNYEIILDHDSEYTRSPTRNRKLSFKLISPKILEETIVYRNNFKKPIKRMYKFESNYKKTLISEEEISIN